MNKTTLEKMKQMKFFGMYDALQATMQTGNNEHFTPDEIIAHIINAEYDDRENRKIKRCITNARFRYQAELEKIKYDDTRNLEENTVMRLAECSFIEKGENLLITGSTGVGKSYIASALGHHACSKGFRVNYFNTTKLLSKLKMAKADNSYIKEMRKIERQQLLIIDDFGLQPLDNAARGLLLDMIEDRHGKSSLIITSQFPVNSWHDVIGDNTVADAILDRIVHNSHRIELKGESMRRKEREISVK
tara:strand:- start:111 stop:851 length:741 start_codon:yes stop_codon:yes gene_type:complete